ncbi:MAG: hemerythrin domain-containing protein [Massilia sp.]
MNTFASYLEDDHAHCDACLKQTNAAVREGHWDLAAERMAAFVHGLERHLLIEERFVFTPFEQVLGEVESPTTSMRAEHQRIRAVVQRLAGAVEARDGTAFVNHADSLLLLMHQHSEREEGLLYPLIQRVLAQRRIDPVAAIRAYELNQDCVVKAP